MLTVIDRPGHDPQANLDFEERLFNRLREAPHPTLLFYVNDPCVVLGRSNAAEEWADLAALAADGVPVLRRFSGGGAVYHDHNNLNYSFLLPRSGLDRHLLAAASTPGPTAYIAFFRHIILRALEHGGAGYAVAGVSDITLHGRKVSGNAQRIASTLVLHHGTVLLRCPLTAIERYLRVPPNRPGIPHRGFVTGLAEEGRAHTLNDLKGWIEADLRAILATAT